ncbi:MAG: sulfite exporter TauE/SafE family protein [Pusillimonas sp.]
MRWRQGRGQLNFKDKNILDPLFITIGLGLSAACIGVLTGATGIGGFLIIPALVVLADLDIRTAIGTALVLGAASGLLGAKLYRGKGNLPWALVIPLVIGAACFAMLGGWLNQWLPVRLIAGALGFVMVVGSLCVLRRKKNGSDFPALLLTKYDSLLLVLIGCLSGLVAGLTGAGGPLISIPLMTALAYPVLASIGASQVMQIVACIFGVAIYWEAGNISWSALAIIVPLQLIGTVFGVRLSHAVDSDLASRSVALLGILGGIAILGLAVIKTL